MSKKILFWKQNCRRSYLFEWLIEKYLIHIIGMCVSRTRRRCFTKNIVARAFSVCDSEVDGMCDRKKITFFVLFASSPKKKRKWLCKIKRVFNCLYVISCDVKLYTSRCVCVANCRPIDIFLHPFHMFECHIGFVIRSIEVFFSFDDENVRRNIEK